MNDIEDLQEKYLLLNHKEKLLCEQSFYTFFVNSWHITNPNVELTKNWHLRVFCEELQAMTIRLIKKEPKLYDLCINTPPKSAKSFIFSVAYPAWVWTIAPHLKFITSSYSPDLAARDCGRSRDLIMSDWYQSKWGNKFYLLTDAREHYVNSLKGERWITTPRSKATGRQADIIITDDPNAAHDRYSQCDRELTNTWWDDTMWSRLDDQNIGIRIVIQQRIDEEDLTGHIIQNYKNQYRFISLPADLSEGNKPYPLALEKYYESGLMFPGRLNKKILEEARQSLRSAYSGQYNQSPIVKGGRYFKESWVRWFNKETMPAMEQVIVSVDASFTDSEGSCPASIQVWGKKAPNYYMIYDETERMTAQQTANRVDVIARSYPGSVCVIENAANGFFVISDLKRKHCVYQFNPSKYGGKEVRAEMIASLWECGNVFIFDNITNRTKYIDEILSFPNSKYVDRVDAMSQALLYFTRCQIKGAAFTNVRHF